MVGEQLLTAVPEPDGAWWREYFVFSLAALKAKISMFCGGGNWVGWLVGWFVSRKC